MGMATDVDNTGKVPYNGRHFKRVTYYNQTIGSESYKKWNNKLALNKK